MTLRIAALVAAMITFTVIANLLLRVAGTTPKDPLLAWWAQPAYIRLALGFASFGVAGIFYALILRLLPLNVAQSFTSLQFVAIILASWLILHEPITLMRWVGIALIAAGVLVVAWSQGG